MLDKIIKGRYSSTDFKLQVILCHCQTSAPRDWESLGWRPYVNKGELCPSGAFSGKQEPSQQEMFYCNANVFDFFQKSPFLSFLSECIITVFAVLLSTILY